MLRHSVGGGWKDGVNFSRQRYHCFFGAWQTGRKVVRPLFPLFPTIPTFLVPLKNGRWSRTRRASPPWRDRLPGEPALRQRLQLRPIRIKKGLQELRLAGWTSQGVVSSSSEPHSEFGRAKANPWGPDEGHSVTPAGRYSISSHKRDLLCRDCAFLSAANKQLNWVRTPQARLNNKWKQRHFAGACQMTVCFQEQNERNFLMLILWE